MSIEVAAINDFVIDVTGNKKRCSSNKGTSFFR